MTVAGVISKLEQRVEAHRHHDVVGHRQQRPHGHPPLEPDRDVGGDDREEGDQGGAGLAGDLRSPRRADGGDAHVVAGDAGQLGQGVAHAVHRLGPLDVGPHPDRVAAECLDLGVGRAGAPQSVADLRHRHCWCRDLPGGSPLELDAQIDAPHGEAGETHHHRGERAEQGPPPEPREVDLLLSPVRGGQPAQGQACHDVAPGCRIPGRAREAGIPNRPGWAYRPEPRDMRPINGPMKKYVATRSRIVASPR